MASYPPSKRGWWSLFKPHQSIFQRLLVQVHSEKLARIWNAFLAACRRMPVVCSDGMQATRGFKASSNAQ